MDNVKDLTITFFTAIIFCQVVVQIESQIIVIFKQTWGYEPTFYKKIQSFFLFVLMLGLALVSLVFYMAELDTGQVKQIFRKQLTYSLLVAIGILITMLVIEIFRFTIFAQFCCHVLLASLTQDAQNDRAQCIYMDPFDCFFPNGTNTITNRPSYYPTVNSTVCPFGPNPADKLITHLTVIEFWLIVANFGCCWLLICLIRTLINLSNVFEQYSLQTSFFNKLNPTGLRHTMLIITCLSYLIAIIVFCISFYRGASSFYGIIIQWEVLNTGWMKSVQILFLSYAIFSALMVLMFLIPQNLYENTVFGVVLAVTTYAFIFGWLAIVVSIGIPTYITFMYTCYCKFLIANEKNLPNPSCLRFQTYAWSLFGHQYYHFYNCGSNAIKICKCFLEAKSMLIIAYIISTLFVPALTLFLMCVKIKKRNADISSKTSRKSPASSLSSSSNSLETK